MKVEIKVPSMGESITEATVGTLIKASGSIVAMDDEIVELETDKVNQVLYAPQAGMMMLSVKPEDVVKIGQVIGFVETDKASAKAPEDKVEEKKAAPEPAKEKAKEPEKRKLAPSKGEPARFSREDAVQDLLNKEKEPVKEIPQSLLKAAHHPQAIEERTETRRKMTKIRKVIAARLVEAQQQTAMLTTFNEVDMTQVMQLRERYKDAFSKEHGVKLGFMSFFVKAVVSALEVVPELNSYIDGDEIVHREYYDIGIAVGTDRGLVVPVIRNCGHLSFSGIESSIENYAKLAREGGLSVDDLQGGGFTITNGGVYGSLLSAPILNYPQSGILGMHKIEKRPVVVDDQIIIRPMMYIALSYDHRIVDGKGAVSFLVHVKNMLEDPSRLLLEV